MALKIEGKIVKVLTERTGLTKKGNSWNACKFLVETFGNYPEQIVFDSFGECADFVKELKKGMVIRVFFNISANEYNDKYYNQVRAYKVEDMALDSIRAKEVKDKEDAETQRKIDEIINEEMGEVVEKVAAEDMPF